MLQELYIYDLALIDRAQVTFGHGLNVLTGETGAGKTVVVGAVNLLLGGRADASLVRRGSARAEVQGVFSIPSSLLSDEKARDLIEDDDQIIVRRVVSADGKSKCYVNDRVVTVGTLAEIGRRLIDLHGQHEHQSLFKTSTHVDFLDTYGGQELLGLRARFQEMSAELRGLRDELARLKGAERELLGKKDLLEFQIREIDAAELLAGEDAELTRERDVLRNAEKLYSSIARTSNLLAESDGAAPATGLVAQAVAELRMVASIDPRLDVIAERLNGVLLEAEDCATSLRDYGSQLEFPPGRLQEVEDRLAMISLLKRKYGPEIDDILAYRENAGGELLLCDTSGERIEELEAAIARTEAALAQLAERQSGARTSYAVKFSDEVLGELADLNMPNARFEVSCTRERDDQGLPVGGEKVRILPHGVDRIEFMVSANKGEPAKPLAKIASGGEISRVMLALKIVLADADELPTLIFDEVDTGIGGATATAVGQKMSLLARKRQVLAVTHLPQIASFADRHFSVAKKELEDRTVTEVDELVDVEKISEMARLLSGNTSSDVSLRHAEELLHEAQKSKLGTADGRAV